MNRYSTRFGAVCAIAFVVATDLAGCSGDDDADTGASTSSGASGAAGTSATAGSAGRASTSTSTSSTTTASGGAGGGGAGGDAGDGGSGGATGGGGAGGSQMGGGGNGGDRAGAGGMDAGRDGAAGRDGGSDGSADARSGDARVDGGSDARETGGDARNDVVRSDSSTTDSSTTDGSTTDVSKDTATDNASPDGTSLDVSSDGASPDVSSDGPAPDASGGPCTTNANCTAGWFCSKPICLAASGTCRPKPATCSNVQSPTCGCDKVTYWNDCLREQAGTASSSSGVCLVPALCGGPDHLACPTPGAVCGYMFGSQADCQLADPSGSCWMPPSACPAISVGAGWRLCGGDAGVCVGDCEPLQSGLKYYLDETCPQ